MAIKRNQYTPGNNLTNLAVNVDDLRRGVCSLDFTTSTGLVEVNGNTYLIENGDGLAFGIDNASDPFITVTDKTGSLVFGSSSITGTYDPYKLGFYLSDNSTRVLPVRRVNITPLRWTYVDFLKPQFRAITGSSTLTADYQILPLSLSTYEFDLSNNLDGTVFKANYASLVLFQYETRVPCTVAGEIDFKIETSESGFSETKIFYCKASPYNYFVFPFMLPLQQNDVVTISARVNSGTFTNINNMGTLTAIGL